MHRGVKLKCRQHRALEQIYEKSKVTAENLGKVLEARAAARGEATVSAAEVEEVTAAMEAEQAAIANEQMPSVKPEESASEDVSTEELEAMIEQQNASLDEDGKLVPPPGCILETDAEGAGRGLYVGEFSRMEDGSLLGSADTAAIQLSAEVPQVERKGSRKPDHFRKDYAPITVWRRADGRLELITGQRRLAAAKENGEAHVAVRVFDEDSAHDSRWARLFHAEQNIRDKQATVEQVAYYYRETGLTDAQAEERGLLPRDRNGRPLKTLTMGATIARMGSDAVYADLLTGKLTPKKAYAEATKEQPSGVSMAVDIETIAQEEQEIISRAKEESTYMKAPNGKKSNLTPKQWAQVRTQAFKAWFGDWETLAKVKTIQGMKALAITPHESLDKNQMKAAFHGFGDVKNRRSGRVAKFPSKSAGKIFYHKGFDSSSIVRHMASLFEYSVLAFKEDETPRAGHKEHRNYESYEQYVNKFSVKGDEYFIRFTVPIVRNSKESANVHSTAISQVAIYKKGDSALYLPETAGKAESPLVDKKLASFFASVNEKDVSKVVDENGEPLVVYHGSDAEFNIFDPTKGRANMDIQGMFFSPWEIDASGYGGNVRAFFLNIRKPANEQQGYGALRKFAGQNGAGVKARELLKKQGFDGVNNESEEYIAFESTQIKSATDNRGTFDAGNADVTMSLDLDNGLGAMQMSSRAGVEEEVCQQMLRSIMAAEKMWKTTFKGSHDERESARGHMMGLAMGVCREMEEVTAATLRSYLHDMEMTKLGNMLDRFKVKVKPKRTARGASALCGATKTVSLPAKRMPAGEQGYMATARASVCQTETHRAAK